MTAAITDAMIDDILTAAFEGGSNYWIDAVDVSLQPTGTTHASDAVAGGGLVSIKHGDERDWLNRASMERGITMAADAAGISFDQWFESHDASDADNALQYALFGEVIYG